MPVDGRPDLVLSAVGIRGGLATYGHVAGILMLDSTTPRAPGDPGHAATFAFPVLYEVVQGFSLDDLRTYQPSRLVPVLEAAHRLERRGVNFISTDCGLFALYQRDIAAELHIPFLGSALSVVPFVCLTVGSNRKVGIITGHSEILSDEHLDAAGIDRARVEIEGMENCREFVEVVIGGRPVLDLEAMKAGALAAAGRMVEREPAVGAFVLECPNLVTFRADLQRTFCLPVFDVVTLVDVYTEGCRLRSFESEYISPAR